jgi:hypothetical protein
MLLKADEPESACLAVFYSRTLPLILNSVARHCRLHQPRNSVPCFVQEKVTLLAKPKESPSSLQSAGLQ